jgi:hypothetical protein
MQERIRLERGETFASSVGEEIIALLILASAIEPSTQAPGLALSEVVFLLSSVRAYAT